MARLKAWDLDAAQQVRPLHALLHQLLVNVLDDSTALFAADQFAVLPACAHAEASPAEGVELVGRLTEKRGGARAITGLEGQSRPNRFGQGMSVWWPLAFEPPCVPGRRPEQGITLAAGRRGQRTPGPEVPHVDADDFHVQQHRVGDAGPLRHHSSPRPLVVAAIQADLRFRRQRGEVLDLKVLLRPRSHHAAHRTIGPIGIVSGEPDEGAAERGQIRLGESCAALAHLRDQWTVTASELAGTPL